MTSGNQAPTKLQEIHKGAQLEDALTHGVGQEAILGMCQNAGTPKSGPAFGFTFHQPPEATLNKKTQIRLLALPGTLTKLDLENRPLKLGHPLLKLL